MILLGVNGLLWIAAAISLSYLGITFLLESFIGGVYGILYTLALIEFDSYIHELCEKTGFIVRKSRRFKFYVFFACLGLFTATIIYFNCEIVQW